jgi:hypothetical protein
MNATSLKQTPTPLLIPIALVLLLMTGCTVGRNMFVRSYQGPLLIAGVTTPLYRVRIKTRWATRTGRRSSMNPNCRS